MENLHLFLHIIAWPLAILGTLWGSFILYMAWNYPGSVDEMIDKLAGQRKIFNPWKFLITALICWAYLIAF